MMVQMGIAVSMIAMIIIMIMIITMVIVIIEMIMIMIKTINGGDNKYVQYYRQCSSDSFLLVEDMKFCHLLIHIYAQVRSIHSEVFCKKIVLKNFVKLWWDFGANVFREFCEILKNTYFYKTPPVAVFERSYCLLLFRISWLLSRLYVFMQ